jgi:HEPN domain-containing protein
VNRLEFRQLAEDRIADDAALLAAGRWSGAFYLAGYAVECGLKACIARLTNQDDFPPSRKTVEECYTHDLGRLLKTARLTADFQADAATNPALATNWDVAANWDEASRYEQKTQAEAQQLYDVITNVPDGVLPWIRQRW